MSLLTWILLFSLLGGVLSVLAASIYLALPERWRDRTLPHFVSFAIGALLGAAFLALLPHALAPTLRIDPHNITATVLYGLLGFFLLERMVIWRHCHTSHCDVHGIDEHPNPRQHLASGTLVLIGDGIHNFVDGVLIAAAFLVDIHLGIVTALAVAAHEIPQEVGDFAVLLASGYSRQQAFLFNVLTSLTTVVGAVIAYYSLSQLNTVVPYILAIAAASFIYVAVADLIPGLHQRHSPRETITQIVLILLGVAVIGLAHSTLH
jgi:zinc and cadmium transporter